MLGLKVQDNADFGAEIIRKVREHSGLSRVELARVIGVAASTIGRHVDALVATGYFTESVEPTKEAGRPPTRLRPNPARGCFLGVDFYADMMFATAVNFAQETIAQRKVPLQGQMGVESVLREITAALAELTRETHLPLLAVGLAVPGRVDTRRGVGLKYVHVPGWENVPLSSIISDAVNAPVYIENNIRTMSLAERWFGEGRGCQDLVCLGVRYGIAAGVIRDGQLATGHQELGGEIRGWNCPVYNAMEEKWEWRSGGTFEKYASVTAALTRYNTLSGSDLELEGFLEKAQQGDQHALTAVREVAAVHGWAIAQMVQLIDPEIVVVAGPLTALGDLYLDSVRNFALQFESDYHPSVPILISELGEFAGAVGAAALALEKWRPADVG
ncbi:ROK family protein [Verrucomicrobium spinosum]|uniref:ROK family protein n=1 Tax=Verrucomicrobium spinosum TaxID=2736 RepID=UPI0001744D97|nr:ROK family protein [Verrucomicrobium spinosum]